MEKVKVYGISEVQLVALEKTVQQLLDLQRLMANTILMYVRAPTFARRAELRGMVEEALALLDQRENAFRNFMAELNAIT